MKFLLILLLVIGLNSVQAQSRCATVCGNNPACAHGLCTLTKCSDVSTCFFYCLNCDGSEKCYATGSTCAYSSEALLRISNTAANEINFSYVLAVTSLFLFNFI